MAKKANVKMGSALTAAVVAAASGIKPGAGQVETLVVQQLRDGWQETAAGALAAKLATDKVRKGLTSHMRAAALTLVPLYIIDGKFKAKPCAEAFSNFANRVASEMQAVAPKARNGEPQAIKKLHPSWLVTVSQVASLVERSDKAPTSYATPEVWVKENKPERGAGGAKRTTAKTIQTIVGHLVTPKAEASLMGIMQALKVAGKDAMPLVEALLAETHAKLSDIVKAHPAGANEARKAA